MISDWDYSAIRPKQTSSAKNGVADHTIDLGVDESQIDIHVRMDCLDMAREAQGVVEGMTQSSVKTKTFKKPCHFLKEKCDNRAPVAGLAKGRPLRQIRIRLCVRR